MPRRPFAFVACCLDAEESERDQERQWYVRPLPLAAMDYRYRAQNEHEAGTQMRDVNQGQWRALDPFTSTDGGGETLYGTLELSILRGSDGRVGGKGHMQDVGHHLHEREGRLEARSTASSGTASRSPSILSLNVSALYVLGFICVAKATGKATTSAQRLSRARAVPQVRLPAPQARVSG